MSDTVTVKFYADSNCDPESEIPSSSITPTQINDGGETVLETWTSEDGVSQQYQSGFFCNSPELVSYFVDVENSDADTISYIGPWNPPKFSVMGWDSNECLNVSDDSPALEYYFKITCNDSPGPNPDPSPTSSSGLSEGEIAAIVTGSVVGAILIYVLYIKFFINK